MKKKRHTTEEIIRILRKADEGQTVEEVCREVNISEQTFYRWRRKYGRMEMAGAESDTGKKVVSASAKRQAAGWGKQAPEPPNHGAGNRVRCTW